jgi:hypothetical protein
MHERRILSQGEAPARRRERELDALSKPYFREMERLEFLRRQMQDYARITSPKSTPVFACVEPVPTEENPPPRDEPLITPSEQRKPKVREYKLACEKAGVHVTNADICIAANYRDEKVLYRWQRAQVDCPRIEAVLRNKPHLKKSQKSQ